MDRRSLYDDDIYAWAQEQAAALRRLAETRRDLPNELDLENVAEEIEDVGKSELFRVESFIRLILVHLIKAAPSPAERPLRHWEREITVFGIDLARSLTSSMRRKIDLDGIWRVAGIKADAELMAHGEEIVPGLPGGCPFSRRADGRTVRLRRGGRPHPAPGLIGTARASHRPRFAAMLRVMDRRPLYDEDYFAWLQQQAAALRQLARDRRDLPNDLDIDRVAEEIEDVGKSELRAAESFATNLFSHLLLLAFDMHAPARDHWRGEVAAFHRVFRKVMTPSMRRLIDLDDVWEDAWGEAQARLLVQGRHLPRTGPPRCPFGFDELAEKQIDWDEAVRRIVDAV